MTLLTEGWGVCGQTGVMQVGAIDVLYQPAGGTCAQPPDALAEMDAAGVAVAMVSQCKQWSCERQWLCVDTRLEDVTRYVRASNRFVGLAGYNPFDPVESLRQMQAGQALGFRGTYLHAASFGVKLGDARLYPLYAKSSELGLPVVVQVSVGEPALPICIERIGRDFPELLLAIVHPRPTGELLDVCGYVDGLMFVVDTPALEWMRRQGPDLLRPRVVERCMWGSNGDRLVESVSRASELELPAATVEAILRGNAMRYFAASGGPRAAAAVAPDVTVAET